MPKKPSGGYPASETTAVSVHYGLPRPYS